jgi:hypothetical protein
MLDPVSGVFVQIPADHTQPSALRLVFSRWPPRRRRGPSQEMQAAASVRRGATAWAESQFHSSAAVLSKSTVIPTRTRTLPRCSLNNLSTICLFFQTYLQFSTPSLQSLLAIPSHQCVSCSLPDNQFAGIHGSVMLTCAIVFLQKKSAIVFMSLGCGWQSSFCAGNSYAIMLRVVVLCAFYIFLAGISNAK